MRKFSRQLRKNKYKKNKHVERFLSKARAMQKAGQWAEADKNYREVVGIDPENHLAWNALSEVLQNRNVYAEALRCVERAVSLSPENVGYLLNLASVHLFLNNWEDVIGISKKVLSIKSTNPIAFFNIGYALKATKQLDESVKYLDEAIKLLPDYDSAHAELCAVFVESHKYDLLRNQLHDIESLLATRDKRWAIYLNYALGKYYDILGEYNTAFRFFSKANAAQSKLRPYDIDSFSAYVDRIISTCDKQYFADRDGVGFDNRIPIFILGMPRSGSSLIEQVLASHPLVSSGGELSNFYDLSLEFNFSTFDQYNEFGRKYVGSLQPYKGEAEHVTDKMPHNFMYAALILLALPKSVIIHSVRDPMDTCFSCYRQGFTEQHQYSCDQEILGRVYKLYEKLMRHWHCVMPNAILDVQYEDVINNFEGEVRKIVEFCGLEWNEACLKFYETDRRIQTASRDQVIKPIYSSSLNRWKRYEKHLQQLKSILVP